MEQEKFLITGAVGQLGYELHLAFGAEDGNSMPRAREAFDITSPEVLDWLPKMRPDAIINCAAYTDVQGAEKSRERCWQTNVLGVEQLCKVCTEADIPLIHISTDFVFGLCSDRLAKFRGGSLHNFSQEIEDIHADSYYRENDPVCPCGAYGASKAAAEHTILRYASIYPDFQYFIIRTAGLFERPWRQRRNFPLQIAQLLHRRGTAEIPVIADVATNITYVPHLAQAIKWLVENRDTVTVDEGVLVPSGIYHIANRGITTWADVAKYLVKVIGNREKLRLVTRTEFASRMKQNVHVTPMFTCLNLDRYHSTFGPEMPTWADALDEWLKLIRPCLKRGGQIEFDT